MCGSIVISLRASENPSSCLNSIFRENFVYLLQDYFNIQTSTFKCRVFSVICMFLRRCVRVEFMYWCLCIFFWLRVVLEVVVRGSCAVVGRSGRIGGGQVGARDTNCVWSGDRTGNVLFRHIFVKFIAYADRPFVL